MFILDLYKWCESYERFTRQHIAAFIFKHHECERLARAAGVSTRFFASSASKEFLARMMSAGYIDGVNNWFWSKGAQMRPFQFDFKCYGGDGDRYTKEMMSIEKLSDDELFGGPGADRYDYPGLR